MTKSRASVVWEAFCGELTQEPTDDMREALATAILKIIDEYEEFMGDDGYGRMVVSSMDLRILSNDLETLQEPSQDPSHSGS
jgi:hypothetical protein